MNHWNYFKLASICINRICLYFRPGISIYANPKRYSLHQTHPPPFLPMRPQSKRFVQPGWKNNCLVTTLHQVCNVVKCWSDFQTILSVLVFSWLCCSFHVSRLCFLADMFLFFSFSWCRLKTALRIHFWLFWAVKALLAVSVQEFCFQSLLCDSISARFFCSHESCTLLDLLRFPLYKNFEFWWICIIVLIWFFTILFTLWWRK